MYKIGSRTTYQRINILKVWCPAWVDSYLYDRKSHDDFVNSDDKTILEDHLPFLLRQNNCTHRIIRSKRCANLLDIKKTAEYILNIAFRYICYTHFFDWIQFINCSRKLHVDTAFYNFIFRLLHYKLICPDFVLDFFFSGEIWSMTYEGIIINL